MRKLILFVVIVALVAGAISMYLRMTTPQAGSGIRFPLPESQRSLLASTPAHADAIALIPTAAALYPRLEENPVTREALAAWARERQLPRPWMLGDADLVIWRTGDRTTYGFRLDSFRAFLVRGYLLVTGADVHVEGSTFLFGDPSGQSRIDAMALTSLLEMASALPSGDALVIQRRDAQMFPPMKRPAASTVTVGPREITITSRAASDKLPTRSPETVTLPDGALLSAWFGTPPRVVGDIDRLLPGNIGDLLAEGGSAVLYDVETRRLLPRPRGLFVVADNPAARAAAGRLSGLADLLGEVAYRGGRILIGVDRTSVGLYSVEQFSGLPFRASEWAVRMDAGRMVPIVERLGDNTGLRFATPRLHRSVRDLRRWIGHLRNAGTIEAALTATPGHEELRVRITAK